MDTSTRQASATAAVDVSLVRGGLFYRLQQGLGLVRPNHWNLGRRIVIFVAVAWLPLVLITTVVNRAGLFSLLTDYRVYSRLLICHSSVADWRTADGITIPDGDGAYLGNGPAGRARA